DVAAAVRAFADRDGDVLRRLPVGAQGQGGSGVLLGGGHAPYRCGLVLVRRGPRGFGDVKLEAAPAAGDRESVALPGGVGLQGGGELGARGVAHQHRRVRFDGDAGAEDVEVAPVAVLVLSVQAELGEVRTVAQVEGERVVFGRGAVVGALVVGGYPVAAAVLRPVEEQVAPGEDFGGTGAETGRASCREPVPRARRAEASRTRATKERARETP